MRRPPTADTATESQVLGPTGSLPRLVAVWPEGHKTLELLPAGTVVVGRADDADVSIHPPSVSRHHVRIHSGPVFAVEDLGSSNGTFLGGERLARGVVTPW